MEPKKFVITTRAIILHEDKLLVMRMISNEYYALPGGKLEVGETIHDSLKREIIEELGVEPQIGRFLFVNSFIDKKENQAIDFFFEVTNGADYKDEKNLKGTHSFEYNDLYWAEKNDEKIILPKQIQEYLNDGTLISDTVRFIN